MIESSGELFMELFEGFEPTPRGYSRKIDGSHAARDPLRLCGYCWAGLPPCGEWGGEVFEELLRNLLAIIVPACKLQQQL